MSYTKGPWVQKGVRILDKNGFQIAAAEDVVSILYNWHLTGALHWSDRPGECYLKVSDEVAEANAKLISAAPDLLQALQDIILPLTEQHHINTFKGKDFTMQIQAIQTAIKKATE